MKKFNLKEFKGTVERADLSYRQISIGAGVSRPWLKSVLAGRFDAPNPEWLDRVRDFIKKYDDIHHVKS